MFLSLGCKLLVASAWCVQARTLRFWLKDGGRTCRRNDADVARLDGEMGLHQTRPLQFENASIRLMIARIFRVLLSTR